MHEMSLAESVLHIIEDAAREQGFSRVKRVTLEIGKLSCVEPEALRFCFDSVMQGTLVEQAELQIVEVAGQGKCEDCAAEFHPESRYDACPECGNYRIRITGGDAMRVYELEVS
ncbi:MAG: hydrogenase maturation nickel metallochaperone HypA [Gallionella sp.]|jgi:hydrogenase nickel incorporation protein HypA/HybF|nr:hydrogenase maturation nickel metallochaperone HypA [Gallionella sp.]